MADVSVREVGFERDSFSFQREDNLLIRWWVYLHLDGARPQAPRRGVVDRGFRFARGGRVRVEEEARRAIEDAFVEARSDWEVWLRQPSHALGPHGELVPLDEVRAELLT